MPSTSIEGTSSSSFHVLDLNGEKIKDEYCEEKEKEKVREEVEDEVAAQREKFLSIYKEEKEVNGLDESALGNKDIIYKV